MEGAPASLSGEIQKRDLKTSIFQVGSELGFLYTVSCISGILLDFFFIYLVKPLSCVERDRND